MITSNELELKSSLTLGTLESNAEAIKEIVLAKLQDYKAENYVGKATEAKQDRAVLNNAEKALNAKRLELERSYMEPFNNFKNTVKETCDALKQASGALDAIVKAEEEREKDEKRQQIQEYWNLTGFTLFPLDKVFDPRWTNKTAKYKDVTSELDAIQKKTFDELKIIENFPAEDVALIKTVYLDTLSITEAMTKAEQLKANRDRLVREKTEREAIERQKALEGQRAEETQEINHMFQEEAVNDLASEALKASLGIDHIEEVESDTESYAIVLHGTRDQLIDVRRYMTRNGVTYTKLVDKGDGVYTAE